MLEKETEQKLVKAVKAAGGKCLKFTSPGFDGMPDRIILMPEGRVYFAEIKAPGKKPRPLQSSRHAMLRRLGFRVYVVDRPEQIKEIVDEIQTT